MPRLPKTESVGIWTSVMRDSTEDVIWDVLICIGGWLCRLLGFVANNTVFCFAPIIRHCDEVLSGDLNGPRLISCFFSGFIIAVIGVCLDSILAALFWGMVTFVIIKFTWQFTLKVAVPIKASYLKYKTRTSL